MKKLLSLLLALVMVLSLAACGAKEEPAPEKEEEPKAETEAPAADSGEVDHTQGEKMVWLLPQTQNEDNPSCIASDAFAEAMAEATGGRWTIEVYYGGSMGSENETLEMCRVNTIQIVPANVSSMEQYIPDFGVFVLPYLFRTWDDLDDYIHNSPKCVDLWTRLQDATNLKMISVMNNGTRCLSTVGIDPIKSPEDLKGTKIRSMEAPVWQNVISCLGGSPIAVAFNELYVALQTGVVQGQDNPLALTYSQKFYEVLDDFYKTDHCYNTSSYYVNADAWNGLSDSDKELFNELWQEYMIDYYNEIYADFEANAIAEMEKSGLRIWEQEDLDMEAFYASADEMIQREYMSNEIYAGYITDVKEYCGYN
jgi:tripartite ATP-independent transporter DctP family solute receptor